MFLLLLFLFIIPISLSSFFLSFFFSSHGLGKPFVSSKIRKFESREVKVRSNLVRSFFSFFFSTFLLFLFYVQMGFYSVKGKRREGKKKKKRRRKRKRGRDLFSFSARATSRLSTCGEGDSNVQVLTTGWLRPCNSRMRINTK